MQKAVLSLGLGLLLACAPELRSGDGDRCDDAAPCADGFECYRGFCVPEDEHAQPEPVITEEDGGIAAADAGTGSASARDAGAAQSSGSSTSSGSTTQASGASQTGSGQTGGSETRDASTVGKDAGVESDAGSSKPSSTPAVTPAPATTLDAAAPSTQDAGTAAPPAKPPATTPPVATPGPGDAGTAIDAGIGVVPDAALPKLPKDCTLEDCCAEATRGKGEGNEGKGGGKKCGCDDPALLRTLTCSVGGVVGGVVGVLL